MPSITLTPEQEQRRQNLFFSSGLKGAVIGLGIGALATSIVMKRSPEFRALSRPVQSIMLAGGGTAGFLFATDSAVTEFENREMGYTDEDMIQSLLKHKEDEAPLSSFDQSLQYLDKNRWSFIGMSWAVSMVGAFGYSFSNRFLTTQQKVVQARMYAQAVTIAVLMASAGISIYVGDEGKPHKELPDPQLRAVLELPYSKSPKPDMMNTSSSA
ncbi:hypothetical protein BY458DRAFT_504920 [Sporodiniella umbellata]|nr:hypothetical protein BY458DRAFT_504920 [Sporodiniella umbellata]